MRIRSMVFALALLVAACGPGDSVTEPEARLPQGSLSARIDGVSWSATLALTATMGMAVGVLTGPGTYPIGAVGGADQRIITEASGRSWHAFSQSGSGSVTITTILATRATGTFSFTAPAVAGSGASGRRVVAQGAFDLEF